MKTPLFLPLLVLLTGCPSDEAEGIANAIETFIDFGMSNEERAKAPSKTKSYPHLHERSRKIVESARGGPRLEVVVDLPHDLADEDVSRALDMELARIIDETPYPSVKIEALATGLSRFGGPMGKGEARRDSKGDYDIKILSLVSKEQPPLTVDQYEALVELELALARSGSGDEARARSLIAKRHGEALLKSAIGRAKKRYLRR